MIRYSKSRKRRILKELAALPVEQAEMLMKIHALSHEELGIWQWEIMHQSVGKLHKEMVSA